MRPHSSALRRSWWKRKWFHLQHRFGSFRELELIEWDRVRRIVFVCKGNVCRSPYAEARARTFGLQTVSCGLEADESATTNPMAAAIGEKRGVKLTGKRAQSIERLPIGAQDILVGMEPGHVRPLREVARAVGAQVTLLGLWTNPVEPWIPDPYGGSNGFFESTFDTIDDGVQRLARCLVDRGSGEL